MKTSGIVLMFLACAVTAAAQAYPALIDNTFSHTVTAGSPSTGGPGGCNPKLNLPPGTYRYRYVTSGGTFINNFFLMTNFNAWTPGGKYVSNGTPVPLLFSFHVPPGVPLCSTETVHLTIERWTGAGMWDWSTFGKFALKVIIGRNGERGHLVSDDALGTVYYGGADRRVHSMHWTGSGWTYAAIHPQNGWGNIAIEGQMAIFADGSRIFFKGVDRRLYELVKNGTNWTVSQVLTSLPNVGGTVAARNSNEVVFYGSDGNVHRLTLNGTTWTGQVVAPSGGWGSGGGPRPDSISLPRNSTRIFFVDGVGALWNLNRFGTLWPLEQVSQGLAVDGGDAVSVEETAVYYKGLDARIHRYVRNGSIWTYDPMTISTASETNVVVGGIAFLAKFFGEDKVFYKSSDGRIYNLYKQAGAWYNYPLAPAVGDAAGDLIAAQWKIFYVHHDKRVHNFYWTGNQWVDGPLSTAAQADTSCCINVYTR